VEGAEYEVGTVKGQQWHAECLCVCSWGRAHAVFGALCGALRGMAVEPRSVRDYVSRFVGLRGVHDGGQMGGVGLGVGGLGWGGLGCGGGCFEEFVGADARMRSRQSRGICGV